MDANKWQFRFGGAVNMVVPPFQDSAAEIRVFHLRWVLGNLSCAQVPLAFWRAIASPCRDQSLNNTRCSLGGHDAIDRVEGIHHFWAYFDAHPTVRRGPFRAHALARSSPRVWHADPPS